MQDVFQGRCQRTSISARTKSSDQRCEFKGSTHQPSVLFVPFPLSHVHWMLAREWGPDPSTLNPEPSAPNPKSETNTGTPQPMQASSDGLRANPKRVSDFRASVMSLASVGELKSCRRYVTICRVLRGPSRQIVELRTSHTHKVTTVGIISSSFLNLVFIL